MKKHSGFTLIGLLVVIAKAREKARQASCQSNEKQLGLAFLQYVQDNDETMPNDGTVGSGNFCQGRAGKVYTYVKSTALYACPDDPTTNSATGEKVSYAMNGNLMNGASLNTGDGYNFSGKDYSALAQQNSPANTVLACEVQSQGPGGAFDVDATDVAEGSSPTANGAYTPTFKGQPHGNSKKWTYATGIIGGNTGITCVSAFPNGVHTDGSNWLAADGHVKYLKGAAVSGGNPATNPNTAEVPVVAGTTGTASGTGIMQLSGGTGVGLTFSPI